MKTSIIALILFAGLYGPPRHLNSNFIGIVTEVKILNMDNQDNIFIWVMADQGFVVKGKSHIPNIHIGDSLYEYWVDYQKPRVGTRRDLNTYEIQRDSDW